MADLNFDISMNDNKGKSQDKYKETVNSQSSTVGKAGEASRSDAAQPEKIDFTNFLWYAQHPIVVFFTLLFKILAGIM